MRPPDIVQIFDGPRAGLKASCQGVAAASRGPQPGGSSGGHNTHVCFPPCVSCCQVHHVLVGEEKYARHSGPTIRRSGSTRREPPVPPRGGPTLLASARVVPSCFGVSREIKHIRSTCSADVALALVVFLRRCGGHRIWPRLARLRPSTYVQGHPSRGYATRMHVRARSSVHRDGGSRARREACR